MAHVKDDPAAGHHILILRAVVEAEVGLSLVPQLEKEEDVFFLTALLFLSALC